MINCARIATVILVSSKGACWDAADNQPVKVCKVHIVDLVQIVLGRGFEFFRGATAYSIGDKVDWTL